MSDKTPAGQRQERFVTKREFLKSAGAVTAGAAAASTLFPAELKAVTPPKKWDEETEVVIVGTGYAGLTSAIEAHDNGAKVVLLDKARVYGGNSITASGGFNAADPERQKKQNIEDSPDQHFKHTLAGGDFRGDPEKVRYLVDHALDGVHWLEKQGVQFEPTVYTIVGALWPRSHDPANHGRGGAIVRALRAQVDKRNIPIRLQTAVTGIIRGDNFEGPVQGVRIETGGKTKFLRARKAVILCTGGFSANVAMRSKYDPRLDAELPTTNVPWMTGEAISYAEDIGADVIGMDYIQLLIACNYYTKKYGSLINLGIDSAAYVNIKGERFVAEDARRDVMANAVLAQPKKVLLWIADDLCMKRFDADMTDSILKAGHSFKADTLEELANILNA
jgi:urocanate reductase